jgi:hypothetical protein
MCPFVDMGQKYGCVRKQFLKMFVLYAKMPYLCIVNQTKKLMTFEFAR